jgi:hypothetical protein
MYTGFWSENLTRKGHLKDAGVDDIKMHLKDIRYDVDWIHLAEDRGQWRALANKVRNFRVPYKAGDILFFRVCVCVRCLCTRGKSFIQSVPGGMVNILGDHSIGHSKKRSLYEHVSYSEQFPR